MVFDDDALYIGAILFDDPEGIIALQKRRDGALSTDDRFQWILDTFHDGRTGYFFEVNAAGMMGDALLTATASGGGGGGSSSSRFRRAGGSSRGGSRRAWAGIWGRSKISLTAMARSSTPCRSRGLGYNPGARRMIPARAPRADLIGDPTPRRRFA